MLVLYFSESKAQSHKADLEKLKAPSMPSATIIATQVNEVNRPKSLKAVEAAILNNYIDENSNLTTPNNFALEFNPFMISGRKNFNYKDYLSTNWTKNLWQNLSVSVSSTTEFKISDSVNTNAMGFGIRTMVLNGKPNDKVAQVYKMAIERNQDNLNLKTKSRAYMKRYIDQGNFNGLDGLKTNLIESLSKDNDYKTDNARDTKDLTKRIALLSRAVEIIESIFESLPTDITKDKVIDKFLELFDEKHTEPDLKYLREHLNKIKVDRYGLRIELDAAMGLSFPTNDFDYSIVPRGGFWANTSYRPNDEGIASNTEYIVLIRHIITNDDFLERYSPPTDLFEPGNIWDFGGRFVLDYRSFSLELEYIYRLSRNKIVKIIDGEEFSRTENFETRKYMLNINYNLTNDIVLSYYLGSGFENPEFNTGGNLLTGLTLNFGFGKIKGEDLAKAIDDNAN